MHRSPTRRSNTRTVPSSVPTATTLPAHDTRVGEADTCPIKEPLPPGLPEPKSTRRAHQSCVPYTTCWSSSATRHVVKSLCHGASRRGTVFIFSLAPKVTVASFESLASTRHTCTNSPRPAAHTHAAFGATAPHSTQSSAASAVTGGRAVGLIRVPGSNVTDGDENSGRHAVTTDEFCAPHARSAPSREHARNPSPEHPAPTRSHRGAGFRGNIENTRRGWCFFMSLVATPVPAMHTYGTGTLDESCGVSRAVAAPSVPYRLSLFWPKSRPNAGPNGGALGVAFAGSGQVGCSSGRRRNTAAACFRTKWLSTNLIPSGCICSPVKGDVVCVASQRVAACRSYVCPSPTQSTGST
mmetsp:Transcript_1956/g.7517  ORF Transcript_1956/g.7517 Transcript_1956/m.7517 type:complete len:354 (+) Transcript_1956:586-1647(+)